jgi:hypothetical protein
MRLISLLAAAMAALALAIAGCGGDDDASDPIEQVPQSDLRTKLRDAQTVSAGDFPAVGGRTLQEVADEIGGAGPQAGLATSVLTVGTNRLAFGMIGSDNAFIYGKTAVYIARDPNEKAAGPYPAPADLLVTEPPYRSKQAATEKDPFAAVYAAEVPFKKAGNYAVLAVTKAGGKQFAAPAQVKVVTKAQDRVPEVGEKAPRVKTDTLESAAGNEEQVDTRIPPSDMHGTSFDEVVGSKPVALLFATPQLCQSRVCGPVTDIALQLKARYGEQMEFIHQEVYVDNKVDKGLRPPLKRFNLPTEPWLFVVDKSGRITARMEGSFGLNAFEAAVKSALP